MGAHHGHHRERLCTALAVVSRTPQVSFLGMRLGRGPFEPPERCLGEGNGELLLHITEVLNTFWKDSGDG